MMSLIMVPTFSQMNPQIHSRTRTHPDDTMDVKRLSLTVLFSLISGLTTAGSFQAWVFVMLTLGRAEWTELDSN